MIPTESLKQEALELLIDLVDSIPGSKLLVLDKDLATVVSAVASFSLLKEHGIDRIIWLTNSHANTLITSLKDSGTEINSVIYLCVPEPESIQCVTSTAKQLVISHTTTPKVDVYLVTVPDVPMLVGLMLENAGIAGDVVVKSWPVTFLPIPFVRQVDNNALDDVSPGADAGSTSSNTNSNSENADANTTANGNSNTNANAAHAPVISLHLPNGGFKDCYIDCLPNTVYRSAHAIQQLQKKYGLISKIVGKGAQARLLADLLLRKRKSTSAQLADSVINATSPETLSSEPFDLVYGGAFVGSTIDSLIIIDRSTDLVTPMLTQLTYLGLINEFYAISDSGSVELPASVVAPPSSNFATGDSGSSNSPYHGSSHPSGSETKKATLHDSLFGEIQDLNFSVVGQTLNKVARKLQSDYEQRHEANTVSEIKSFVSKLGGLQSIHKNLRFHIALAEDLMTKVQGDEFNKWLEVEQNLVADSLDTATIHSILGELICRSSNLSMILRLLCLECLVKGGIRERDLLFFKQEILQTYGYKHIMTFSRLESAGLLFSRSAQIPRTFSQLRKALNLVVDQSSDDFITNPTDISYTYSGYAPLSVRIVQCAIDKPRVLKAYKKSPQKAISAGWSGAEDVLRNLSGPTVDEVQYSEASARESKLRKILTRNTPGHDKLTSIVFYLGGITYAEIAALQFLAKSSQTHNLIIATTGIISGSKIIEVAL